MSQFALEIIIAVHEAVYTSVHLAQRKGQKRPLQQKRAAAVQRAVRLHACESELRGTLNTTCRTREPSNGDSTAEKWSPRQSRCPR